MNKTFKSGIYLSETEPTTTYYVLVSENGEFYSDFGGGYQDSRYFLRFNHLPKEACCFESKSAAAKWKRKNVKWIKDSKRNLTIKPLEIFTTTTYIVK